MPRVVPAVIRALDILELFLDHPQLSAREVAERLDLPRTTVHELLVTLVARSYLISVPGQPVRYRLGMPLFQLGSAFAGRLDLVREAQGVAREVAAACDEAVLVAVLDGADVMYLVKVDSTHPVRMVSGVGRRLPAHCTAVGKILLSSLDPAGLDAVLTNGALPAMTPASITDPETGQCPVGDLSPNRRNRCTERTLASTFIKSGAGRRRATHSGRWMPAARRPAPP